MNKTGKLTYSGVMLVIALILLFVASFVPGVELTLYALASFFVGFVTLELGIKGGTLFCGALMILSFLLVPNKMAILPFLFFFGLYGLAKYAIERIRKIPIEIILKLLFFNLTMGLGLFFFKNLFFGNINFPEFPVWVIIIAGELFFLFYDYLYTLAIYFYKSKIMKLNRF